MTCVNNHENPNRCAINRAYRELLGGNVGFILNVGRVIAISPPNSTDDSSRALVRAATRLTPRVASTSEPYQLSREQHVGAAREGACTWHALTVALGTAVVACADLVNVTAESPTHGEFVETLGWLAECLDSYRLRGGAHRTAVVGAYRAYIGCTSALVRRGVLASRVDIGAARRNVRRFLEMDECRIEAIGCQVVTFICACSEAATTITSMQSVLRDVLLYMDAVDAECRQLHLTDRPAGVYDVRRVFEVVRSVASAQRARLTSHRTLLAAVRLVARFQTRSTGADVHERPRAISHKILNVYRLNADKSTVQADGATVSARGERHAELTRNARAVTAEWVADAARTFYAAETAAETAAGVSPTQVPARTGTLRAVAQAQPDGLRVQATRQTLDALDVAGARAVEKRARLEASPEPVVSVHSPEDTPEAKRQRRASAAGAVLCCICMTEPCTRLLQPCHHYVLCSDCATTLVTQKHQPQCPMCRAPVHRIARVFF